jgi:Predicted Rossmann fold nucleotide-binding protein
MPRKFVIAIIGTGSDVEPAVSKARELGRLVAENGWVLITGGRNKGVMKAANRGAKQAKNCLNIGIINNRVVEISPDVDVAIITDTGEARNNIIVLSADVVIACGVDEAGTASEVALALKNGKHVILLGVNDSARGFFTGIGENRIRTATSPEEAIRIASELDLGLRGIKALRATKKAK